MKTPIAVTLIIMGALLVITPALADWLYQRNVIALLASGNIERVTLAGQMSNLYRFGCWLTGTGMVSIAVLCSVFLRREAGSRASFAAETAGV